MTRESVVAVRTARVGGGSLAALILIGVAALQPGIATAAPGEPGATTGPTSGGTSISGEVPAGEFAQIATSTAPSGLAVTFGLGEDGILYSWGDNTYGQLGVGEVGGAASTPRIVDLPEAARPVTQAAAGFFGGYALGADGNVYAWGSNSTGQAGNGTSTGTVPTPVKVNLPTAALPVREIDAYMGGFALGADGNVYSWGTNVSGQLGIGTVGTAAMSTPVKVKLPAAALPAGQLSASGNTAYVIGADGAVYAWGDNSARQVGNNRSSTNIPTPAMVSLPATALPVSRIRSTAIGAMAVGADGIVYSWGGNTNGQLGIGTTGSYVVTPVAVSLPAAAMPVSMIAGSAVTAFAVGADGTVYGWGSNQSGQLANPTPLNYGTPRVIGVPDAAQPVVQIEAGHTVYLLDSDGGLHAWGLNINGQIGDGTTGADVLVPVLVPGSVVTSVTVGGSPASNLAQASIVSGDDALVAWTASTPAGCGPNDVVISWTQTGQPRTRTIVGGFTFGSAPGFVAQPTSASISEGGAFTALVSASGDSTPMFQWQQEGPAGVWTDIPGQTAAQLSIDAVSVTTSYRAIATNCWGAGSAAVSEVATATVLESQTVTFEPNGGSGTMAPQVADAPQMLHANAFTRPGFVFTGWNTDALGTGNALQDGAMVDFASDLTLFAQWAEVIPETHTVTFNANGGVGSMDPQTADAPTMLSSNAFSRPGFEFVGWDTDPSGTGDRFADGATFDFTADATLFAQWRAQAPVTRTVTFDANGGLGSMDAQVADAPTALTSSAFSRPGFTFAGWNTGAAGTGVAFADGQTYDFASDATLFAQWAAIPPSLTASVGVAGVPRGAEQTVIGGGFAPGEQVVAQMHSDDPLQVGTGTADGDGAVTFVWRIPAAASLGDHAVVLTGATSGHVEARFVVIDSTTGATPAEPPPTDRLSGTGSDDPTPSAAAGLVALLAGAALVWMGARRRPTASGRHP